eukprot:scaffold4133_cov146-Amphora_coffeaeformis.AAC.2
MASEEFMKDLDAIAEAFQKNVQIQDRKYRLKTYKDCFVGKEAVDYLVNSGAAPNRLDAVELGRALQSTFLFEHVTRDHQFADDTLFFRFLGQGERGEFKVDDKTGERMDWSKFLSPAMMSDKDKHQDWQPKFPSPDFENLNPKDVHTVSHMWPLDEHNTTLLNHVHPPDWQDPKANNPDGTSTYDLVVVGGGTSGLISAAGSAGVGAKVAMIEENMLGGDCLNVGCVPSKAIIHSANMAQQVRGDVERMREAGIIVDPSSVKVDFGKVMERVRKIRAQISHHDSATRYSKELGVEVFIGRGKFTSEQSVVVNGRTLRFKRAVIATGGYPTLIPMEGLKELHQMATSRMEPEENRPAVMTNETFFNLTKQPTHMVVIGAGVVGLELAQSMQRLGTAATVLGRSGRVLPKEDEDMADIVKRSMVKDGVKFRLSVQAYEKIELTGNKSLSGLPELEITIIENGYSQPETIICDALLVAAGRRPNVTGMDLELAKVEYDTKKGLKVNDKLQTTNKRIFGVGDCAQQYKFTHAADFTARADTILGASIVGEGAGNMISEITLAMKSGTGLGALANVIHPYPTTAEVIRQSGDLYNKTKLTTTVKTLLRGVVKLQS